MTPTLAELHPFASVEQAEHALAMPRIAELRGDSLADVQWYAERAVAAGQWLAAYHGCHAHNDGECTWKGCPQLRDGEPERSGRHCPLDKENDYGMAHLTDKRAEELRRYGFAGWLNSKVFA